MRNFIKNLSGFYAFTVVSVLGFSFLIFIGTHILDSSPLESIYRESHAPAKASIEFSKGPIPMQVDVRVVDENSPLAGITVHILNNSGGNSAITDTDGVAKIKVAESEVLVILIDDKAIPKTFFEKLTGYPSADNGLNVKIIKKNSEPGKSVR